MMKRITSYEAYEGQWGNLKVCKNGEVATGFEVRSEVDRNKVGTGNGKIKDNAGAVGLRLICSGAHQEVIEDAGEALWHAKWTGPQMCPEKFGICGFRTQVDEYNTDPSGDSF